MKKISLFILIINFHLLFSQQNTNSGCTDINACNYDESATIDDGSCVTIFDCDEDNCSINMIPGPNPLPFDVIINCITIQQPECAGESAIVEIDWEASDGWYPGIVDFFEFKAGFFSSSNLIPGIESSGVTEVTIPFPGSYEIKLETIAGDALGVVDDFSMPFEITTNSPVFDEIVISLPEELINPLCDGVEGYLLMGSNAVSGGSPFLIM